MTKQVEEVKVLNIDDVPYAVDAMSDEVKSMVAVFNSWNQQDADVTDKLTMVRAAKNDLSRRIILQVRQEKEAKEAAETTDDSKASAVPAEVQEGGVGDELTADDPIKSSAE